LMLQHAVYSVISPEGCASILWRSGDQAQDAAEALRLTAQDLLKLEVIDRIVDEPLGGAHRVPKDAVAGVGDAIAEELDKLAGIPGDDLRRNRRQKFVDMGQKGLN